MIKNQKYEVKGKDIAYLSSMQKKFERTILPTFSGSVDLRLNNVDPDLVKKVIDFRQNNKMKENIKIME